jgi:hypothetical protein
MLSLNKARAAARVATQELNSLFNSNQVSAFPPQVVEHAELQENYRRYRWIICTER